MQFYKFGLSSHRMIRKVEGKEIYKFLFYEYELDLCTGMTNCGLRSFVKMALTTYWNIWALIGNHPEHGLFRHEEYFLFGTDDVHGNILNAIFDDLWETAHDLKIETF